MEKRESIRYSEAFKQEIVSQLESGRIKSFAEAARRYGIKGGATIRRWVLSYGSEGLIPTKKVIMKKDEINELKELKARVRELEGALATSTMKNLLSDAYLDIACERIGIDTGTFKKKHATKLSAGPGPGRRA